MPVENAIAEASTNKIAGKNAGEMLPATKLERYLPVCISLTTPLIVHAKKRIKIAPDIIFTPDP